MNVSIIEKVELIIGLTILVVIVLLVFMASIMRFFGHPLIWSVDFAQLLFIWLCFIGANRALRKKGHLGVDLFVRNLNHKTRFYIESIVSFISLIFLISLFYKGIQLTLLNKERLFGDSGIPYAFVTLAVPFGCLLLFMTLIGNFMEARKSNAKDGTLIFMKNSLSQGERE